MENKQSIAVSGATGFIGAALCVHLVERGYSVIGFCRKLPVQGLKGVTYRYFSLEAASDTSLFKNVDVFIHCAYIKGEEAKNKNIRGTKDLLQAARRAGVKKCIFFSSLSAQADALSGYGQQKFELEKEFYGEDDAVIRPGLVIGAGGLFADMMKHIQTKKILPLIEGGKQTLYTIHLSDVVKATEHIISRNLYGNFTLAHPQAVVYKAFYTELAAALKRKIIFIPLSYTLLEMVFTVSDALGIKLPVDKESLLGLKAMKPLQIGNDLEKMGITPKNYKESFKQVA